METKGQGDRRRGRPGKWSRLGLDLGHLYLIPLPQVLIMSRFCGPKSPVPEKSRAERAGHSLLWSPQDLSYKVFFEVSPLTLQHEPQGWGPSHTCVLHPSGESFSLRQGGASCRTKHKELRGGLERQMARAAGDFSSSISGHLSNLLVMEV